MAMLQNLRQPSNVYADFRVLFMFAFVFGLVPYYVRINRTAPRKPAAFELLATPLGYLNMVLRVVFYIANCFYSLYKNQSLLADFFTTDVSHFTDNMQKFNGLQGILLVVFMCVLRQKYLPRLMLRFNLLDSQFFNVGVVFMYNRSVARVNCVISLMSFCNLGFIAISCYAILPHTGAQLPLAAAVTFYSPQIIVYGMVILFYGIVHKITEYLCALNKVLKNLSHQWDSRSSIKTITRKQRSLQCLDSFSMYTIVTKNPTDIIQESMEIHYLICEAASTANKYFTYQLLTIISIAFLIIVFDAYYVLETLLGKSKRESKFKTVEFVTFFSCQMILYLIAIISIVEGSNRAIKKSEKTGGIVHALLNKANTSEVKEKLQQFSMQLMHMKINFTAAGLFNIDRTLYFTISGALTTYLIILLQFTSTSPPHTTSLQASCCNVTTAAANICNTTIGT